MEVLVHSNKTRDILKVVDFENKKYKYVWHEKSTNSKRDLKFAYPPTKEEFFWRKFEGDRP